MKYDGVCILLGSQSDCYTDSSSVRTCFSCVTGYALFNGACKKLCTSGSCRNGLCFELSPAQFDYKCEACYAHAVAITEGSKLKCGIRTDSDGGYCLHLDATVTCNCNTGLTMVIDGCYQRCDACT